MRRCSPTEPATAGRFQKLVSLQWLEGVQDTSDLSSLVLEFKVWKSDDSRIFRDDIGTHWVTCALRFRELPQKSAAGYGGSPELWSDQGKGCDWYPQVVEIRLRVKNYDYQPPNVGHFLVLIIQIIQFWIPLYWPTPIRLLHGCINCSSPFGPWIDSGCICMHLPDVLATHVEVPARREAGLSVGWVSLLILAEVIWAMPHMLCPARSGKIPSRRTGGSQRCLVVRFFYSYHFLPPFLGRWSTMILWLETWHHWSCCTNLLKSTLSPHASWLLDDLGWRRTMIYCSSDASWHLSPCT